VDNPRPEKVAVVDEVRTRLSSSSAALLTAYRGLKVGELAALRRSLRHAGGEYKIYKNTLVRFAARDLGLEDLVALLEGPTAITFVDGDAATVARALRDYARTNPNLVLKGGVLGDRVIGASDAGALADLPSREQLLARFAGGLAAPLQQLAGLLQALPRNFAYGLRALIDKSGGLPESPAPDATAVPAREDTAVPAREEEPAEEPAAEEAAAEEAAAEEAEPAAGEDNSVLPESPAPDATAEAPEPEPAEHEPTMQEEQ
jgi:large subunit ribosomal protein L10